jgi:hypothetical protein
MHYTKPKILAVDDRQNNRFALHNSRFAYFNPQFLRLPGAIQSNVGFWERGCLALGCFDGKMPSLPGFWLTYHITLNRTRDCRKVSLPDPHWARS